MTRTKRYPAEAFALAMVVFSAGMKEAMLTGICLIFGDVLQCVLRECFGAKYNWVVSALAAVVTGVAVYGMFLFAGLTPETWQLFGMGLLAVLMVRHDEGREGTPEYDDVLFSGSIAYGLYVLVAALREYLAGANIFGFELFQAGVVSASFGKPMLALIFAGLTLAVINRILKTASSEDAALWVGIPVIFLNIPFVWNHGPELLGQIIGIATVAVLYVTLGRKLIFADTEKHIEGLPVHLVMLGIIYMVFGIL